VGAQKVQIGNGALLDQARASVDQIGGYARDLPLGNGCAL